MWGRSPASPEANKEPRESICCAAFAAGKEPLPLPAGLRIARCASIIAMFSKSEKMA
jgi:hypothetical protein